MHIIISEHNVPIIELVFINCVGKQNDTGNITLVEFIPKSPIRGYNWTVNVTITLSSL